MNRQNVLKSVDRRLSVIRTSRGRIEYSEIGRGEPILFFHGGQGNARNTPFDRAFDLEIRRLITPSRPGYGETEIVGNETATATAHMFAELLDAIGVGPVIAIGVSLGARPAIEFAARYPDRVRGLVLESAVTGPWLDMSDKRYRRTKALYSPRFERYVWSATRLAFRLFPDEASRQFVNTISTMVANGIDREDAAKLRERMNSMRSHSGLGADLDHTIADKVLGQVRCPTLLQYSNNDAMVDLSHAEKAQTLIPHALLKTYDNAFGHFMWLGPGSDEVLADLGGFMAGLDAGLIAAE